MRANSPFLSGVRASQPPHVIPFPGRAKQRAPLPPFPPNAADPSTVYDSDLWFAPPAGADKRYWRCNFGGMIIPGIGPVWGSSPSRPDEVLTGFFGRFAPEKQAIILDECAARGQTHFLRWVQDEQNFEGFSIAKYIAECKAIQAAGLYVAHSFLSKTYSNSPDLATLRATFDEIIAALKDAKVLDIALVGFELTEVYPNDSLEVPIDYFAIEHGLTEANGCPLYVHHISEYTWPGVGAPDRRQWWDRYGFGKLTGLCYQNDPAWSIADAQARYRDTTDNRGEGFVNTDSGFGHPFDFVVLETQLEREFNASTGEEPDDDQLEEFGYLSLCTHGALPVMGFGCGARRPDGSYL